MVEYGPSSRGYRDEESVLDPKRAEPEDRDLMTDGGIRDMLSAPAVEEELRERSWVPEEHQEQPVGYAGSARWDPNTGSFDYGLE